MHTTQVIHFCVYNNDFFFLNDLKKKLLNKLFLIEFESISDNVIYFLLKHSSFFFVFCHLDIIHYVMIFKEYHFSKHRLHDQRCVFLFPFVVKLKFKKSEITKDKQHKNSNVDCNRL